LVGELNGQRRWLSPSRRDDEQPPLTTATHAYGFVFEKDFGTPKPAIP